MVIEFCLVNGFGLFDHNTVLKHNFYIGRNAHCITDIICSFFQSQCSAAAVFQLFHIRTQLIIPFRISTVGVFIGIPLTVRTRLRPQIQIIIRLIPVIKQPLLFLSIVGKCHIIMRYFFHRILFHLCDALCGDTVFCNDRPLNNAPPGSLFYCLFGNGKPNWLPQFGKCIVTYNRAVTAFKGNAIISAGKRTICNPHIPASDALNCTSFLHFRKMDPTYMDFFRIFCHKCRSAF